MAKGVTTINSHRNIFKNPHEFAGLHLAVAVIVVLLTQLPLYRLFGRFPSEILLHFWAAGKVALQGGSPGTSADLIEAIKSAHQPITSAMPFYYPRFSWPFLMSFSLFSWETFELLWQVLSIGSVAIILLILFKQDVSKIKGNAIDDKGPANTRGNYWHHVLFFHVVASFYPLYLLLWHGGVTVWPLLGLIVLWSRRETCSSGYRRALLLSFSLMLCIAKPHLFAGLWVWFLVFSVRFRTYLPLLLFGVAFLLLYLGTGLSNPNLSSLIPPNNTLSPWIWLTPTLSTLLIDYMDPMMARVGVTTVLSILVAIWSWHLPLRWESHIDFVFLIVVPWSLLTAPYVWTYDYTVLIPSLFALRDGVRRNNFGGIGTLVLCLFLFSNLVEAFGPATMAWHLWTRLIYGLGFALIYLKQKRALTPAPDI